MDSVWMSDAVGSDCHVTLSRQLGRKLPRSGNAPRETPKLYLMSCRAVHT
jgi:hypothetical protein